MRREQRFGLRAGMVLISAAALMAVALSATLAWAVDAPAKGKSATVDRIRGQGKLRAGIAIQLPWLGQNPKTGQYFGPSIELAERVTKVLDVPLELVNSSFDVIVAGLQANQFDVVIAPLYASEKRRKVVDFVNWSEAGICYVALKDNGRVNTLDDLNQATVTIGTWTGGGAEPLIMQKYSKAKINSTTIPGVSGGGEARIQDVLTRRIDIAHFDAPRAFVIAHQYPELKIIPGGTEGCFKNPDIPLPIGMALNYGDTEFKAFLEGVAGEMREQLRTSLVKYGSLEYMLQR